MTETETGAVVAVDTTRAGAVLLGDHPAGSTTLAVQYGWDFNADGGTLTVAGLPYDYLSAVMQGDEVAGGTDDSTDEQTDDVDEWLTTEDDDRPMLLHLAVELNADAADGDFVAVSPDSVAKYALVKLAEFDEPITAHVPHALHALLSDGTRGDPQEYETVALELDGATWAVSDVIGRPPAIAGDAIDPDGPSLPAPVVPGVVGEPNPDDDEHPEGSLEWIGAYRVENMRAGSLQADVSVASRFWVAEYADPNDPMSGPAEHSAIIEMSPDGGFIVWTPVLLDDGTWLYGPSDPDDPSSPIEQKRHKSVWFPAAAFERDDPNDPASPWHQVAGRFEGELETESLTVSGPLGLSALATVSTGGGVMLAYSVTAPDKEPSVTFVPKTRRWPGSSSFREIGAGHHSGFVVTGRYDDAPGGGKLSARYINPDTGFLDHDSSGSFPFYQVGGFTCTGGYVYVLNKFTKAGDPWTIVQLSRETLNATGRNVNVNQYMSGGYNTGGLGDANRDDCVAFAYRDNNDTLRIRYYTLNLDNHPDIPNRGGLTTTTARAIAGVPEVDVIAAGDKFFWFDGGTLNDDKSWTTGTGAMTGAEYVSGTGFVSMHGNGTLSIFNDGQTGYPLVLFSFTRTRTTVTPAKETTQSPRKTLRWPTRKFATVQTTPIFQGFDDVNVYVGTVDDRLAMYRVTKQPGIQADIASIPTTGTNPPDKSSFGTETPAPIYSQALIPGTSRPAAYVDASGKAELYGLTAPLVRRSSDRGQTVANGDAGTVKIDWNLARETNTDIPYNTSTFTFTCNLAGHYAITAQVGWQSAPAGYRTISCYVNGVDVSDGIVSGGTAGGSQIADVLKLNAGDQVAFWALQNSGSSLGLRAQPNENRVSIVRLGA